MNSTRATILDLAHRHDGYFAPLCQAIVDLESAGLIRTVTACAGYVIVHALPQAKLSPRANRQWRGRHPVGAFAKASAEVRA